MRLLRRMLPEDEFWRLIALLKGSAEDDAVERLVAALRTAGKRTATAFAERLAATLYELDREVLFRQPVRWSDDPDDAEPIPLSDDSFLYLRAAIVAKGKDVVEQVLADPAFVLTRRWDDGEALLYAADEAVGDEIDTKLSYETGSNEKHWSPVEFDPSTHRTPIVAVLLSDLANPIEAYADDAMTIPLDPPFYAWPTWFPMDVLVAASERVDEAIRDVGGLPASLEAAQIQIHVGLGPSWQLTPAIDRDAMDDTGLGRVVQVRVEMPQDQLSAWKRSEQQAALTSLAAACCLAVLPEDHGGREALRDLAAEGSHLLPPG